MPHNFLVDGHKVTWKNGLAEFHRYGILIKIPIKDFTLDWACKMNYKLSILRDSHLVRPADNRGPADS